MQSLIKSLRILSLHSENIFQRADLHITAALSKQRKLAPRSKSDLPEPIKTSWGRMVSRGMIAREPVTEYTTKALKVQKTGGRGTNGRIEIRRIGGGKPVVWHMADLVRITETEADPRVEIVRDIIEEQTRSAYLALVVSGENKRWIIATENMKIGDIIKSTREIPDIPLQAQPGDCHPVGALPIGTQVCCIERYPYDGSRVANSAGSTAQILKKVANKVYIRMPSKREMVVDEKCLCVVGRVSNVNRNKRNLGKAGAKRWLGIRPKSGYWLRKTGLAGRKIKPTPKPKEYKQTPKHKIEGRKFTIDKMAFGRTKSLASGLSCGL